VVVNDAVLMFDMGSPPVTSFYFFTSKSADILKKAGVETPAKTQRGNYKLHKIQPLIYSNSEFRVRIVKIKSFEFSLSSKEYSL